MRLPWQTRQKRGQDAEATAAEYLQQQGLQVIARNVRYRGGELDLVCLEQQTLVFVEVRLRSNSQFGDAADSINIGKQQRVIVAAQLYLQQHPQHANRPCRFDCILFSRTTDSSAHPPEWLRNAFTAD